MQASLLQLEKSFVTRLHVEANTAYPKEKAREKFTAFAEAGLESVVEFGPSNNPRLYFVKLSVMLPGTESGPTPYIINIEVFGSFSIPSAELPVNEKLIEANGPAVLYGSIRELVMQMTSRGPYPPMILPTVNFIPPNIKVGPDGVEEKQT